MPVSEIIGAIRETLEVTLPELAADIIDKGIYITGGTLTFKRTARAYNTGNKIAVHKTDMPLEAVAIGASVKLRRAK